ncbi:ada2a-containing complex component 3 isoform d [Anaeramoeba ignava]|uniref:Ada2a-containing complex component 3 isoform d n=1 Tax=Anaeramoeba ignava TaxID=1746090 RepID=A0A9Q0LQK8_ANAIG|nr:ada2a-containing complex component 3 isoform d [Anaeramoeba ignava]
MSKLFDAIEEGNFRKIKRILKGGVDPNFPEHNTALHLASKFSNNYKLFKLLLSYGANANSQNLDTPLHYLCTFQPNRIDLIRLFLKFGGCVNARNMNTPLHYVCMSKTTLEVVKFLVSSGALVNAQNKFTIFIVNRKNIHLFHLCVYNSSKKEIIRYLISQGARIDARNGKTPSHFAFDENIKDLLKFYNSIQEDFKKLFKRSELCDLVLKIENKQIQVHSMIFQFRIPEIPYQKIVGILEKKKLEEAMNFLKFVYYGRVKNLEKLKSMIYQDLGLGENYIEKKEGKQGLVSDLKMLYLNEKGQDFKILVGKEIIKTHKLILFARSRLFRGMFLSVKDDSNSVHDYTQKPSKSIQQFFKFLYFDEIPNNIQIRIAKDLLEMADFYQINKKSYLFLQLEEILQNKLI